MGLRWQLSWWRIHLQCRTAWFNSWVGKICWRRERLPTPVYCSWEFHGLYDPMESWGHKELDKTEWLSLHFTSRFIIAFLPGRKCLLISRLQSQSAVTLEPKKIKSLTVSIVSPSIYHEEVGQDIMILVLWKLSFKSAFSLSLSPSSRGSNIALFLRQ